MTIKLVRPTMEYKKSFLEAEREYEAEGKPRHARPGMSREEIENNFPEYLRHVADKERGYGLPPGYVPSTDLWLVDKGEFIGSVAIRHTLNEHLLKVGGLIGYGIRPSKRNQGYGTKILELALPYAKKLGIDRVLITCDADNLASARIIEKNGGVLENIVEVPGEKPKRRYWIDNK